MWRRLCRSLSNIAPKQSPGPHDSTTWMSKTHQKTKTKDWYIFHQEPRVASSTTYEIGRTTDSWISVVSRAKWPANNSRQQFSDRISAPRNCPRNAVHRPLGTILRAPNPFLPHLRRDCFRAVPRTSSPSRDCRRPSSALCSCPAVAERR